MSQFFRLSTLALAAGTLLAGGSANAADILVSATVENTCVIDSAGAMAFGTVNFTSGGSSDGVVAATSTILTTCTSGASYSLTVDDGLNENATTRRMLDTATTPNDIAYVLGTTAGASDVAFGGATGNFVSGAASDGTQDTHTLHGTATVTSADPVGTYSDTLVVSISF